jgi:hypothetical protein
MNMTPLCQAYRLVITGFLPDLFFYPEDGGDMLLRNVGGLIPELQGGTTHKISRVTFTAVGTYTPYVRQSSAGIQTRRDIGRPHKHRYSNVIELKNEKQRKIRSKTFDGYRLNKLHNQSIFNSISGLDVGFL